MASIEWKDFVPSHLIPQILCGCLDHFSHGKNLKQIIGAADTDKSF